MRKELIIMTNKESRRYDIIKELIKWVIAIDIS